MVAENVMDASSKMHRRGIMTFTVEIQLPEGLREIGCSDEAIRREVPVLLVLKRFRQGELSSGKAASLLGISRRDFLDLLANEGIPFFDPSDVELEKEIESARRLGAAD
jgi:predicted HTH domain antitoxin